MIREFIEEDFNELVKMLTKGLITSESDIRRELLDGNKRILIYVNEGIKGFLSLTIADKETKKLHIQLYVDIEVRGQGIGTALYKAAQEYIEQLKPNVITTEFRTDINSPDSFYREFGFRRWWGSHEMSYKGEVQPEIELEYFLYEDKFYEEYSKLIEECFYDLRRKNDIQPYRVEFSSGFRGNLLKKKDSIYMIMEDGKLAGTICVENGYIDNLAVDPAFQGRGLGKRLMQFAINRALKQTSEHIHLSVLTGNDKAEKLYKDLGFEILQTIYYYRQFGDL